MLLTESQKTQNNNSVMSCLASWRYCFSVRTVHVIPTRLTVNHHLRISSQICAVMGKLLIWKQKHKNLKQFVKNQSSMTSALRQDTDTHAYTNSRVSGVAKEAWSHANNSRRGKSYQRHKNFSLASAAPLGSSSQPEIPATPLLWELARWHRNSHVTSTLTHITMIQSIHACHSASRQSTIFIF